MTLLKFNVGQLAIHPNKPEKITSKDVVNLLDSIYNPSDDKFNEHAGFAEMRIGVGYKDNADQRMDYWAISCWSQLQRTAYEIKVARSDFLKEIKNPRKRRYALLLSNQFYFVAPKGMIKIEELPADCGLKEVEWVNNEEVVEVIKQKNADYEKRGGYFLQYIEKVPEVGWHLRIHTSIAAPERDSLPPSWRFVASLSRRIIKLERERGKRGTTRSKSANTETA